MRGATVGALIVAVALGVLVISSSWRPSSSAPEWFADPALLVAGGSASAELLKWAAPRICSAITFRPRSSPWRCGRCSSSARMLAAATLFGALGYVIAGSIGAAGLGHGRADAHRQYAQPGADQTAIATTFGLLTDVVFRAVWQLVDGFFIAVWMIGTGLLIRIDQPAFARLARALGVLFLIGAMFNVLGFRPGSGCDAWRRLRRPGSSGTSGWRG